MSIAITLGVTTPETSYSDMAAGSDPESVEASPAVNEKNYNNHSCGSAKDHGYRGLPYAMQQSSVVCCQDHNYGAPPPPTPPASPLSQTVIPRMDLNGAVRSSCYHRDPVEHSADSDSSSEEDGAGSGSRSGWCQCSPTPDGSDINCRCRELDRRKGEEIQHRKSENISAGESSATESGDEEVSPSTISYTATQHTPTSIKLTVNRVKSRKSKKRKKSTEKTRGVPKVKKVKAFREGSRKSLRMKGSSSEAVCPDETIPEGLESRILHWTDQYQEAGTNQYNCDLLTLLRLHHSADTISSSQLELNNTVLGSQMQLQLGRVTRVQKHRKILRAAQNLDPDTLIIEYRGKVMLKQQFEVNGHLFKKPCPFVLFYSKFNDVELCVDARTFGNDARFIRRSCTPNAEVRHVIAEGQFHLCIYAIRHIAKDSEVTIEFDYDFNSCKYKVDCACHKGNHSCPVQKYSLSPAPQALSSPPVGAETRRRKAQRKELESNLVSNACDPQQDIKDLLGSSDPEERTQDGLKEEEHGIISSKTEDPPLENSPSPPLAAPPKPVKPPKPRSKSRISRYRSNSSQRARRQRQALAHQASAAAALAAAQTSTDQGSAQNDEVSQGPYGSEPGHGELGLGVGGHHVDGDNQGPNSFHRGSVRYPKTKKYLVTEWLNDKVPGGEKVPLEVPVERPLRITTDTTVLATTLNMLPGHSHSSLICTAPRHYIRFGSPFNPERRRPRPLQVDGTYGCYKKRWIKQMEDESCSTSLEDGTESTSSQQSTSSRSTPNPLCNEASAPFKKRHYKCMTEIRPVPPDHLLRPLSPISPPLPEDSLNPLLNTPHGSLLSNGLAYSPRPLLCTSRCNTPLQFENISSPEASPVHRPESVSPEPSLQAEFDASRPSFLDLSLPSSLESPVAMTSDDFCIHGVTSGQDSQGQLPVASCPSSDSQRGEQAFRTEFNLIYTCSPLNANLGNPVSGDRRPPQADGVCSPSDSLHSSMSVQGPGSGSMSPYGEPYYGVGYTDSSTSPHTSNPPQRKKVSLLEYRKRKRGGVCDSQPTSSLHSRPGSYYSRESQSSQQPPASPQPSSSSAPRTSIPQREELSPPDNHGVSVRTSNQWMVPTTVERLREGRVLERVLRSIKMEQTYRNSVESAEKESDADQHGVPVGSMTSSPIYTLQSTESRTQTQAHTQTRSPSFTHQTSNSPFQSSYSPSSGPGLFPRLSTYSSPPSAFSSDSWQPAASQHQQSGSSSAAALGLRTQRQTKTDLGSPASREGQQQVTLSSRIQCGPGPAHYPQQGSSLGQFQHAPLQGPGVQTQSGSF